MKGKHSPRNCWGELIEEICDIIYRATNTTSTLPSMPNKQEAEDFKWAGIWGLDEVIKDWEKLESRLGDLRREV